MSRLQRRSAPPGPVSQGGGDLGILMLLRWNGLGGTQRQALRLSAELRSLGVKTFVITWREDGLPRDETINDVAIHRVGRFSRAGFGSVTFLVGSLLWMVRHRHAFHIIHAHNLPTALTAALLRPLLGKPIIVKLNNAVTVEEFARRRFGSGRWFILRRSITRFVALNADVERRLTDQGIPASRIVRIPNGVELPPERPSGDFSPTKRALGLGPDTRIVIYLGRLIPDKGIAWLLEVWKDIASKATNCHLLLVGDGPDDQRLRALAHRLDVTRAVSFLGYQDDVNPFLSIADILVLPSRSEGMSNAVLEGMAHGVPVVATDSPGNRAVIEPGRHGLLVQYGDSPALKETLLTLLGDSDLRLRLGRDAARKVRSKFSLRAIANAYCGLYRELSPGQPSGATTRPAGAALPTTPCQS